MHISEFDFPLPEDLIAQRPVPERGTSRLLVLRKRSSCLKHVRFDDLPGLLQPGDLLVVNDTKVFPARLLGARVPSGGAVEWLLLGRIDEDRWDALVHPGQKLHPGAHVVFRGAGHTLHGEVLERHFHGRRTVRLSTESGVAVEDAVDAMGHIPLPPYIKRQDNGIDRERYQTVYASARGSIAAPTAGLHFTSGILDALDDRGVERATITLHVGYGTFRPVRVEQIEAHTIDPERFSITEINAAKINRALADGRRVIAVGTTTTRALESSARAGGGRVLAQAGQADLFIYPGFEFQVVDGLATNFHLPKSSLLMLVSALGGREAVLSAYREAVDRKYRFYSYGDAMLII
jgi:S-adenosylmethionine:tRNA ribosyltransferase-isomerase